jgi:hypothetical protein
MTNPIMTRLEINVLTPDIDIAAVSTFAIKHRCPAIVITPEFAPAVLTDRAAKNGQYNIINAVDFPDGKSFCFDKFRDLQDVMTLEVDGMDILLTSNKTHVETKNEVKSLVEFLRQAVNPTWDLRYVLGYFTRSTEEIDNMLDAAKVYAPSLIRIDQHLEIPNVGVEQHIKAIKNLRPKTPKHMKVSGNVDLTTIEELLKIDTRLRFDVTMKQALHIANQIAQRNIEPESAKQAGN